MTRDRRPALTWLGRAIIGFVIFASIGIGGLTLLLSFAMTGGQ